ncbi:PspC domain-containing protein [Lentibacillus saliphilus]|uniref:PspC domain-containing protein n=1 Tax=Lentibacillus saliphilus TaxID=2737028 RepID=UPI001C30674D|nr:PspC domain-containing protein [Lentibacillus saliphilus]
MTKRLYRSESKRMIAGICGGLEDYFKIDATLIRLIFVAGMLFSAFTLFFVYLVAILVIPNESEVQ